jgi:hypothetical protein
MEMKIMQNLKPHPNILQVIHVEYCIHFKLFGVCFANEDEMCMVMAYCANGSLERYLAKEKIPVELKIKWIKGIALGMFHLAKESKLHTYSL